MTRLIVIKTMAIAGMTFEALLPAQAILMNAKAANTAELTAPITSKVIKLDLVCGAVKIRIA